MKRYAALMVRRATSDDLDQVATVWHRSASSMDAAASPMPSCNELRDRVDTELASGWELFVAERDHHIVGMLALRPLDAVLDQIFVLPEVQATGIGTALLNLAKERMPDGFRLRMAYANERAGQFYERAGLTMACQGSHPVSGAVVSYYRWDGS